MPSETLIGSQYHHPKCGYFRSLRIFTIFSCNNLMKLSFSTRIMYPYLFIFYFARKYFLFCVLSLWVLRLESGNFVNSNFWILQLEKLFFFSSRYATRSDWHNGSDSILFFYFFVKNMTWSAAQCQGIDFLRNMFRRMDFTAWSLITVSKPRHLSDEAFLTRKWI